MGELTTSGESLVIRQDVREARLRKLVSRVTSAVIYAVLAVYLVIVLFPIYWIITSSFKLGVDTLALPPVWFFTPTLEAYWNIFVRDNYLQYLWNSIVVSLFTTLIAILLGSLAAYSLDRLRFRFSDLVSYGLLTTRMIFPIVYAIPLFRIMFAAHLLESQLGLIIAYTTFSLPYAVWIMQGFFNGIPTDLDDAAMIDGCSRLGAFWRVILPLAVPGLLATSIFVLMLAWNEFLFALILAGGGQAKTLPVATSQLVSQYQIQWNEMSAVATVAIVPMLAVFFLVQKHLVRGLVAGAVK